MVVITLFLNMNNWSSLSKDFKKMDTTMSTNKSPLVLFHGTNTDFEKFDSVFSWKNKDSWFFGKWFYFTPHKDLAKKYGDIILSCHLKFSKLAIFEEDHAFSRSFSFEKLPDMFDKEKFQEDYYKKFNELIEAKRKEKTELENKQIWGWAWIEIPDEKEFNEEIVSELIKEHLMKEWFDWVKWYNPISKEWEYVIFDGQNIEIISKVHKKVDEIL